MHSSVSTINTTSWIPSRGIRTSVALTKLEDTNKIQCCTMTASQHMVHRAMKSLNKKLCQVLSSRFPSVTTFRANDPKLKEVTVKFVLSE